MTGEVVTRELPYGVGRVTSRWVFLVIVSLIAIIFGLYAYSLQLSEGEVVTGLRDIGPMGGAVWGLYIVLAVYFAGIAFAGITVAALVRLFNLSYMKPVARIAGLMTTVTIILGGLSIIADLGQPLRGIVNLFAYARPQSPFFGTFTLIVAGYFVASLTYLYLDSRRDAAVCAKVPGRLQRLHRLWAAGYGHTQSERERHRRVSFWLAIIIIPILVVATSTLGFAFSLQAGRPGWYSALQAPTFVVVASISGLGLLLLLVAVFRKLLGERAQLNVRVFGWMGKALLVLILVYIYFLMVDLLTGTLAATAQDAAVSQALLVGEYAGLFWLSVGAFILALLFLVWQHLKNRWNIGLLVLTGLLVNVGALLKRYLIVVPSQIYGTLLPYEVGSYAPTWVEYGTLIGILGLGMLLFGLFTKLFPIVPLEESLSEGD